MIYAIAVWTILLLSTTWMVYQSIQVKHYSLNNNHTTHQLNNNLIVRSHAKLLLVLILLWWVVYLIVNMFSIHYTARSMNLFVTIVMICLLTPLFSYLICYAKHRLSNNNETHYIRSCTAVEWTLNILTALIYASIINYSIQMMLMF